MPESKSGSRSEIINAARTEFLARGYEGARMKNISDHIGVSQAMIHYYFNTKKELFEHVYAQSVVTVFDGLSEKLEEDIPIFKKIEQFIDFCLQRADDHSEALGFIITESRRNPDWLIPLFKEQVSLDSDVLKSQIEEAASDYLITSVEPEQLLLNIFSLCYYPTLAFPVHNAMLPNKPGLVRSATDRKGIVLDTVLNWLTS
ncbi:TetR/AcrR family transcriptional regulator [Aliifodinibius salicampi]|uniref:TetR/AcrR family transcriptional regulator n=1 Tax=Fodinibius salicampi TaxID=1920655 RepID=A0ABT3Q118_9BACT|nr:TetR/AcrR family transcriptional regulator [Fodinibius salicampi]MCW9713819.1 TetR/AcrR family transcriptional regulator [Fodinibius salicampi]